MIATINQWAYVENNLRWEKKQQRQKVRRVRLLNRWIFTSGTAEYPVEVARFACLLFGYFSLVKDLDVVKPNAPDGMFEKYVGFISHVHFLGTVRRDV